MRPQATLPRGHREARERAQHRRRRHQLQRVPLRRRRHGRRRRKRVGMTEYLRPRDVEALFGPAFSVDRLKYMRQTGGGPAWMRFGRAVVYSRGEVEAYIVAAHEQAAEAS